MNYLCLGRYLECISMRGQAEPTTTAGVDEEEEELDLTAEEMCISLKPSVPVLDDQQISAIAVL